MKQKGFTLVEIVIVIAIIGILAAVTVVALRPQEIFKNGRNSRRTSDVAAMNTAIGQWLAREGADDPAAYTTLGLTGAVISPGDGVGQLEGDAASVLSILVTVGYMQNIPLDPDGSTTYRVGVNAAGDHVLMCTGNIEFTTTYPAGTYPNNVFCQSN